MDESICSSIVLAVTMNASRLGNECQKPNINLIADVINSCQNLTCFLVQFLMFRVREVRLLLLFWLVKLERPILGKRGPKFKLSKIARSRKLLPGKKPRHGFPSCRSIDTLNSNLQFVASLSENFWDCMPKWLILAMGIYVWCRLQHFNFWTSPDWNFARLGSRDFEGLVIR